MKRFELVICARAKHFNFHARPKVLQFVVSGLFLARIWCRLCCLIGKQRACLFVYLNTTDQSSQLTGNLVKKKLSYFGTPETEALRIEMSLELLKLRKAVLPLSLPKSTGRPVLEASCV